MGPYPNDRGHRRSPICENRNRDRGRGYYDRNQPKTRPPIYDYRDRDTGYDQNEGHSRPKHDHDRNIRSEQNRGWNGAQIQNQSRNELLIQNQESNGGPLPNQGYNGAQIQNQSRNELLIQNQESNGAPLPNQGYNGAQIQNQSRNEALIPKPTGNEAQIQNNNNTNLLMQKFNQLKQDIINENNRGQKANCTKMQNMEKMIQKIQDSLDANRNANEQQSHLRNQDMISNNNAQNSYQPQQSPEMHTHHQQPSIYNQQQQMSHAINIQNQNHNQQQYDYTSLNITKNIKPENIQNINQIEKIIINPYCEHQLQAILC